MKGLRDRIVFLLAVHLGPWLIRLMGLTWRIRTIGYDRGRADHDSGRPVLYTFWHGRLLPLTYTHRNRGIVILISRHRDGEMITRVTESLGFGSVRGSTGKGGARAILEMARAARTGANIAITPDGPKGPREVVQAGIVYIAQRSEAPVIPLTTASSGGITFRSWDRFRVPALFSKVVVVFGEPIEVPPNLEDGEVEKYRFRIEKALTELTVEADRLVGSGEPT